MWFTRRIAAFSGSERPVLLRLVAALTALISIVMTPTFAAARERPLRILYLSQSVGFVHETVRRPTDGLAASEIALQAMGRDSGAFTVEFTQDARDLTPARLSDLDVLVFSTTGALPIDRPTWDAIVAWIESGRGGFVGIHSAADTRLDFEGGREIYTAFLGGQFDGHPWTQGTPIRLTNLEPGHRLMVMWPNDMEYAEEIYQYAGFNPGRVRVLQTLDMSFGPLRRPYPVPVTWIRQIGEGRLFYTNLGHTLSTWDDPRFRIQIIDAVRWAGGRLDAPAGPNPEVQDRAALAAFTAVRDLPAPATVSPTLAADIRDLQALYPKPDAHTAAWDGEIARLESVIRWGTRKP